MYSVVYWPWDSSLEKYVRIVKCDLSRKEAFKFFNSISIDCDTCMAQLFCSSRLIGSK